MLRWFPRLEVATACFSCSPPEWSFLHPYFILMYMHYNHCHRATAHLQLNILLLLLFRTMEQDCMSCILDCNNNSTWRGNEPEGINLCRCRLRVRVFDHHTEKSDKTNSTCTSRTHNCLQWHCYVFSKKLCCQFKKWHHHHHHHMSKKLQSVCITWQCIHQKM